MPSCVHTMHIFPGRREFLLSVFLDSRNSPFLFPFPPSPYSPFLFFPWLFRVERRLLDFSRALKKIHRFPSRRKTSFENASARRLDQERRINFSLLKGPLLRDAKCPDFCDHDWSIHSSTGIKFHQFSKRLVCVS